MVPKVLVPVDAVMVDPNVAGPDANKVPIVAVPVDAVMLEPKVTAPKMFGIVAVLMVDVEIVAVLMVAVEMVAVLMVAVEMVAVEADNVPIVAVPVEAVRLVPKVTTPESRLVPSTAKVPVLRTPVVERLRAEEVSSPSVMTWMVPLKPPVVKVLRSCG